MQTFLKLGLVVGALTSVWLVVSDNENGGGGLGALLPDSAIELVGRYVDLSRVGLKTGAPGDRSTR